MEKEVAVRPLGHQSHSRNCRVTRQLCARNARNHVATHPCADRKKGDPSSSNKHIEVVECYTT